MTRIQEVALVMEWWHHGWITLTEEEMQGFINEMKEFVEKVKSY